METTFTEREPIITHADPTLEFKGKGSELFSIQIVNIALMLVTLGLYYPWAKAKNMQYIYRKTELAGSPFTFHGTGKEMFIGFIKGIGLIGLLYATLFIGTWSGDALIAGICALIFFAGIMFLIPVAIHGMMRYRTSRTSWRGIHMGYRGKRSKLVWMYIGNLFLTFITLGLYASWFTVNIRKEVIGNTRFGNAKLRFTGEGGELFMIHFKGYLLSVFTLGIYLFWYAKDLVEFYVNNIMIEQKGKYSRLDTTLSGWEYLKLIVVNLLIMVCTLGLGYSWVVTRTLSLVINNCEIIGEFNPDALEQTEGEYKDATYEDMADMLDIGII